MILKIILAVIVIIVIAAIVVMSMAKSSALAEYYSKDINVNGRKLHDEKS